MSSTFAFKGFICRVREVMRTAVVGARPAEVPDRVFNDLARELFALQYAHNPVLKRFWQARGVAPETLSDWREIPAIPTGAFKEFDVTSLPEEERTTVFYSSGTTAQQPSRHFHSRESLAIYQDSLWPWFATHLLGDAVEIKSALQAVILTPPPGSARNSSLVHMFEVIRRKLAAPETAFVGELKGADWLLNPEKVLAALEQSTNPVLLLGTAFSFVHLLDWMAARNLRLNLVAGTRVMETGGYKGRSRAMPRAELHSLITCHLGIPPDHIISEYGMSELSSQAYDRMFVPNPAPRGHGRAFQFPPWARYEILSPETGQAEELGKPGLLRICDLANVFSAMTIQTEDVAISHGAGFQLIGRAAESEPRGCSLMSLAS